MVGCHSYDQAWNAQVNPDKRWMSFGALLLGLGIMAGAFGAHALKDSLPTDKLEVFKTGVHYHQVGSIAILVMAAALPHRLALRLLASGTIIFALTLYGYTILGIKWLAMVTPVGGALMIAGCLASAISTFKAQER